MSEISCDEVLSQVEHYLHGELASDVSARLADHLRSCSPCWERAEFQRKFKEIVRGKCVAASEPPAHVVVRIRETIRTRIFVRRPPEDE